MKTKKITVEITKKIWLKPTIVQINKSVILGTATHGADGKSCSACHT